ncbi:MAG TPA: methylmalonyl-CoA mutase family protein, partial [Spirochaetia bacterium]|nr:methylmalonyl-CoA mutase family protein [Spirochaetia bacterium]
YTYQMDVESGERIVVGLNKFQIKEAAPEGLLKVDPAVGKMQEKKLADLRGRRDNAAVRTALEGLATAAQGSENLMPRILEAVRQYATLGEICDVLRGVFGEYQQKVVL